MGIKDGIIAMGTYTGVVAENLTTLQGLIGDPDEVRSDGRNAGSNLDEMSPMARAQLSVELDAVAAGAQIGGKDVAYGTYTAVAADATANQTDIVTGLADLDLTKGAVSIKRSGTDVTGDAAITEPTAGTIRVADGSTYVLTAGDIINWLAVSA